MRRSSRHISAKECYEILKLDKGADLDALKSAYRRRAFELHPDLNPGNAEAGRQFQRLNEAYVALSAVLKPAEGKPGPDKKTAADAKTAQEEKPKRSHEENQEQARKAARAAAEKSRAAQAKREEARQAENEKAAESATSQANAATDPGTQGTGAAQAPPPGAAEDKAKAEAGNAYAEQDVLRDLLNDPFARRVFEDIYSELGRQQVSPPGSAQAGSAQDTQQDRAQPGPREASRPQTGENGGVKKNTQLHQGNLAWGTLKWNMGHNKGVKGMVKDWLRRQIDEEQSLTLPTAPLAPGKHVRLQIRQGISGELRTVEITLPPDFAVGKPVRLRGLGKRVGPWRGDLYLTLYNE